MTDKELQKLGRRELLQMLLEQAKEAERLGALLKESEEKYRELEDNYERLRGRLDKKDAQIHNLRATLQTEREKREISLVMMKSKRPALASRIIRRKLSRRLVVVPDRPSSMYPGIKVQLGRLWISSV